MTVQEAWNALLALITPLFSLPENTLGAALTVIVVTAALALVGTVAQWAVRAVSRLIDHRRQRRQALVDLIIYARFMRRNVLTVANPDRIRALRTVFAAERRGWRAYVAIDSDATVTREMRKFRRTLATREMAAADIFLASAQLFELYYANLASDAFANLSLPRKLAVLDNLFHMGGDVLATHDALLAPPGEVWKLALKIGYETLVPIPATLEAHARAMRDGTLP